MRNPDLGATVMEFMAILESIDYSKFEKFSNVADEISGKLVTSFLECGVLVVVPDRYEFKFSIKAAERQKTQFISRKLKLLVTEKSQHHFKVTLGIRTI